MAKRKHKGKKKDRGYEILLKVLALAVVILDLIAKAIDIYNSTN